MQALIIKILDDIRGSWRFRWLGLAAAWAACLIGWMYVFAMPNVYEAKARVYVDSKTVLGPLLRGLALDPNVESELSVVRQALLSRPTLETVARKTDLDLRAKTPEAREGLLASLQKRIVVVTEVRQRNSTTDGLYAISFQDHSREKSLGGGRDAAQHVRRRDTRQQTHRPGIRAALPQRRDRRAGTAPDGIRRPPGRVQEEKRRRDARRRRRLLPAPAG